MRLLGEAHRDPEEAAIARTPKTSDDTPKPRRATAKVTARTTAKPAAKPKAAAKAPARAKTAAAKPRATAAKPKAAAASKPRTTAAKPRVAAPKAAAPKAATRKAAAPKATAPKAAPRAKAPARAAAAPTPPKPARAKRSPRQKVEPAMLDRLVAAAQRSLEDDKAENLVVLDVTGRADYADRLVIATGLADRQIQAMATHLEEAFEKEGLKLRRDAIQGSPDWVLIDAGDLVVHLFKPEARALYALERMWGPDSPAAQDRTPLPDDGSAPEADIEEDDL